MLVPSLAPKEKTSTRYNPLMELSGELRTLGAERSPLLFIKRATFEASFNP
jgi:hypothetical protein